MLLPGTVEMEIFEISPANRRAKSKRADESEFNDT